MPRAGVETNTAVKDAGKVERKAVAQKKAMPGKEKKPSIHERLEINKRIIQEKQKEVLGIWNDLSTNEQETVMSMLRGLRK